MMKYGCIGEKLGHSFSKEIHNRLFDYKYELCEIAPDKLDAFMRAREFCAVNVTIPYKERVIPYLDEISPVAREIGAVNTVINRNGRLYGDNTDFGGMRALLRKAGISLNEKKVMILGSGGTSKTALALALSEGALAVLRVSRRAQDECVTYEEAVADYADADVIINTTPCGMFPHIGESAVDTAAFSHLSGVVDAVYNPLRSKLVCDAAARGIPAAGGLYMLVAQAALAAEKFTGENIPPEKINRIFLELSAQKENIVLVGMPGSGKSTVGRLLAERLGKTFTDTDEEIVKSAGETIPELFQKRGEVGFRRRESAVVREVSALQGAVIATGGGAVLNAENVALLKENGKLFFIDRPLEQLVATADRPLSSDREALEKRYRERYDIYCGCCDRRVVSNTTPEDAAGDIEEAYYEILGIERT